MRPFTPTLGIKDTSKNTRGFIKENKDIFLNVLKPLLPWIIGLHLFDLILTIAFEIEIGVGGLIASYFYTVLVITWHRVVIHGPDNYIAMNPYKPKRHELIFIGMGILLGVVPIIIGVLVGATFIISAALAVILILAVIIASLYFGYKFSFYFPAKAVDNSITFKQSYRLTTGYYWKFMGSLFLTPLRVFLILIAYMIVGIPLLIFLSTTVEALNPSILGFLFSVPIFSYFTPLLYVYGVTVLSNYYQYALQNKGLESSDD
jgi:hypothetical protein